jgi:hypothetical protein
METFHKSIWQIYGEYGAPFLIGIMLLVGAYDTRGEPVAWLLAAIGLPLAGIVLWYRIPTTLTISSNEIIITYTFKKVLTIPVRSLHKKIYILPFRITYTNEHTRKKQTKDLGNAWLFNGKAIANEEIGERIQSITGRSFQF